VKHFNLFILQLGHTYVFNGLFLQIIPAFSFVPITLFYLQIEQFLSAVSYIIGREWFSGIPCAEFLYRHEMKCLFHFTEKTSLLCIFQGS